MTLEKKTDIFSQYRFSVYIDNQEYKLSDTINELKKENDRLTYLNAGNEEFVRDLKKENEILLIKLERAIYQRNTYIKNFAILSKESIQERDEFIITTVKLNEKQIEAIE